MLRNKDTISFASPRLKEIITLMMLIVMMLAGSWQDAQASQDRNSSLTELAQQLVVERSEEVLSISMEIQDLSLSEALEMLTGKIGVGLSYSTDISLEKKVSLQMSNVPFHEALRTSFIIPYI